MMHVPFVLACGHSFCYDCLNSWFDNKLNCPTCRFELEQPPVLNIVLKDISKVISDLIIDTIDNADGKSKLKEQRSEALKNFEYDQKKNHLFGDVFKTSAVTLIDRSDGVPRCGNCHWEAHGSVCLHCGMRFRSERSDSYYDSEDGDAYNEDDDEIMLYGRDNDHEDRYDSEDSFVDNRGIEEINDSGDSGHHELLSSSSSQSPAEELEWQGFENNGNTEDDDSNHEGHSLIDFESGDLQRALDDFHDQHLDESESENEELSGRRRPRRIPIDDDSDS
ncbi:uncharacterized protein PRCAT00001826001 [Priceomyces carsonii]|uniref:uncharacterized protein n=1 Tax=Priceomyces carsonii TaxID=28549 RepID=UPI002ED859A6|nr:unnamed protein product [Priceomyces carsonii]